MGICCLQSDAILHSDAVHDDIITLAKGADGYISRVNPDVYEGVTQEMFEGMLEQVSLDHRL